ncbi:MAG: hypothetical protein M3014_10330 [Chloroflexota bacterium]|nr:hypothetical protein [Chloroflexota bacterium]
MTTSIKQQSAQSTEPEVSQLWRQLSSQHQQLILQTMRALADLDSRNKGLIALMRAREAEYDAMSSEERAQAEAELADFKSSINANRAPLPPLYP